MRTVVLRGIAVILVFLAIGLVGSALQQSRVAQGDEVAGHFHWFAVAGLLPAGLGLGWAGVCLLARPALWHEYPFLTLGRFWRWLLLGFFAIFFGLGLLNPGNDLARFPCRGCCALWSALLILPLVWPSSLQQVASRWWQTRPGRLIDLLAGNLVVLVLLLELALRGLALWSGQDALLLNKTTGYRLQPGVYANGLRANSLGFADEEFTQEKRPGMVRIAALGDSFSVGTGVSYEDNYLTRLEHLLPGVEVYNFGVCGTGPREYQQLLASLVWSYQPDLVLVPVFIGNDITEWITSPDLCKLHPDALYVELLGRRLFRLARESWRRSAEASSDEFRMGIRSAFSTKTYLEVTAGHLVVCRSRETATDRQRWQQTFFHLERLFADCQAHGIPVAVLLLADEFQVNAELRRQALEVRGWQDQDIDLLLPQQRLREFCRSQQAPCLDLYPVHAQAGAAAFIPNDSHWNALGHRLAAEAVAPWLQRQFPCLQKPAETPLSLRTR